MNYIFIKTIILLLYTQSIFSADEDFIKCPLIWQSVIVQETLPTTAVSTTVNGENHYIARINGSSGGRFSLDLRKAYFVNAANEIEFSDFFEILSNPYKCIINWAAGENRGMHAVKVSEGSYSYIGRTLNGGEQLSGEITSGVLGVINALEQLVRQSNNFQTLQSYSKGLNMEMTQFVFDTSPVSGKKDFMGIDQIINQGPGQVKQTVTHKKRIKQSTSLTTSSNWGHTFNAKISVQPDFNLVEEDLGHNITATVSSPTLSLGYQLSYKKNNTEELNSSSETEFEVTREVTVPPYTSVQVCSTVTVSEDFSVSYMARARYSAPGLTAQEVAEILKKDNKSGEIVGDAIVIEETGKFKGSLALASQFIVAEITDPAGCAAYIN